MGYASSLAALGNLGAGCKGIADDITRADSIRDAIYSKATEITLEVIDRASEIVDMSSRSFGGILNFLIAGVFAGIAYHNLRKCSNLPIE